MLYSLAEEDKVEKREKLLGPLKGFLAVAVLVSGLTFALAAPAGANTLESGGRVGAARLAQPLAADPTATPTPPTRTAPPLSLTVMLICTGSALLLVFVVMILGFILGVGKQKQGGG